MKTYSVFRLLLCIVFTANYCFAQSPLNSVSIVTNVVVAGGTQTQNVTSHASSVNGVLPTTNYTVSYNNTGNVDIVDFILIGKTYVRAVNFDTVIIRRVANAWETTGGNKQHIYVQGPATIDNITHSIPFPAAYPQVAGYNYMERVMKEGFINRGSDNVFNNDAGSDLTFNNIERIDFVYKKGMATVSVSSAGFLIAERGGNDPFKIAAITGVDASGNPTSFGSVLSVGTASYGNAVMTSATYVMRKDAADNVLRPFSLVPSQPIKSIFIKFSDLGITAMQKIYGYALMANDVTAVTSAELLSYTSNTYFPRNTTTASGGMDLASAPGVFHTDQVLPVQFVNFSTQNKNCEQLLQWNDEDYRQVKEYQLEKSTDRENFETIATMNTGQSAFYSYTDRSFKTSCFYRIKAISFDGSYYYSSVIFAKNTCLNGNITLYPNPARDRVTIRFEDAIRAGQVSVISPEGKECSKWIISDNTQNLQLDISKLPTGQYFIKVTGNNSVQKVFVIVKR